MLSLSIEKVLLIYASAIHLFPAGLTLYHPHLPVPSTNFTFVYLDISTLEPQVNFSYVRDSMINGGTGCLVLNAIHVLSHGKTFEDGASTFSIPSYYCWRQVNELSVEV